jgi:hypothetical protein
MPFRYSVYGLKLYANHYIPGLFPAVELVANASEVQVYLNSTQTKSKHKIFPQADPWYTSGDRDEHGTPLLLIYRMAGGEFFRFHYVDGVEFLVNRTGSHVEISWPETSTVEDVATYLLGPIMGFVLCLRNISCLHASAIVIGDQAIALLGPAGAGKSTTAAAFAVQGYSVLTEDVLALQEQNGCFLVQPGYPLLRLWPESVKALFDSPEALPRLTPNWDKRYLDLTTGTYRFQEQPQSLAAIYILGERSSSADAPCIEAMSNREGLINLIGNTYAPRIRDMLDRAQEFQALSRIAASVPLRLVRPHTDPARLPELCKAIVDDFTKLRKD